jgi:transcriptional regulator with XRE-family HTH domain
MTKKHIAKKLKEAFKKTGLAQKELAKKLGVDQRQISKWGLGLTQPSLDFFAKILSLTKKDANYFFEPAVKISHSGSGDIVGGSKTVSSGEVELLKKEIEILKLKLELSKKKK